jgi:hypothetical protein
MSKYEFHHLGCGCGCNDYLRNPKEADIARQEKAIKNLEERNEYLLGRVLENNQPITEFCYALSLWEKKKLITELCDALRESRLTRTGDKCVEFWQGVDVLLQRAREATR